MGHEGSLDEVNKGAEPRESSKLGVPQQLWETNVTIGTIVTGHDQQ